MNSDPKTPSNNDPQISIGDALQMAAQLEIERPSEALAIYSRILPSVPNDFNLNMKMGQLYDTVGDQSSALASFRRAAQSRPDKASPAVSIAGFFYYVDQEQGLAALDAARPTSFRGRWDIAAARSLVSEWKERAERGLPLSHAGDLSEVPFKFTSLSPLDQISAEWLREEPASSEALTARICYEALMKHYGEANRLADVLSTIKPDEVFSRIRFGQVPEANVALPDVEIIKPGPQEQAFYVACDVYFFRYFGMPLLRSMAAVSPGLPVHIHLMGENHVVLMAVEELNLRISATFENPAAFIAANKMRPAEYYGAVRFVRFAEHIQRSNQPLWMMDVDALVNRDPRSLFDDKGDLALRVRAGRIEPWHQFSACLVKGSPAALPYFKAVSSIILGSLPRVWWGLDQFALLSAYIAQPPASVTLLGPKEADVGDSAADAIFWYTAGKRKWNLRTAHNYSEPGEARFAKAFRHYAAEEKPRQ